MSMLRILMLGATGTAGQATLRALRKAGHEVVSFGRRAPGGEGEHRTGDVREVQSLRDQGFRGERFDAVVSCLASRSGTPADAWAIDHAAQCCALRAAQEAKVAHFVLLSAICVQKPKLAFQHAKLAFEAELIASGMHYSIVRPTAFFKSLSGQIERLRAGKPFLVFGDGALTACKPISDRDLGHFMADCLTDPALWDRILPIGGPGPAITPLQQAEMLFDLMRLPDRVRHVPVGLIDAISAGLSALGGLYPPARQKAELARIGRYYATESMLVWDSTRGRYDADATPETGSDTLRAHYENLIRGGDSAGLGAHRVF